MQFGELKLNLWTLSGFQKISISWIDLKILPHKLEKEHRFCNKFLSNLDIGYKSYNTLNWTSKLCKNTFGPLGHLGVNEKMHYIPMVGHLMHPKSTIVDLEGKNSKKFFKNPQLLV